MFEIEFNILLSRRQIEMQHGVRGHGFEVVGSCPVNYCTNKSQEILGKNAYCNQKVRRKINFYFSSGEQGIQN